MTLLLLTMSILIAAELPTQDELRETYEAKQIAMQSEEVARLQELIDTFQSRVRAYRTETQDDRPAQREHVKAMREEVDQAKASLAKIDSGDVEFVPTLDLTDPKLGDVGVPMEPVTDGKIGFVDNYGRTIQRDLGEQVGRFMLETVMGDNEVVLAINRMVRHYGSGGGNDYGFKPKTVNRVIVRGIDTEGLVNDKPMTFDRPFYVSSTQSYVTVAGTTETVFVIEPYTYTPDGE